jgi:tripartite-type tricarboxylate transporter receptor subunit TctC
MLRPLFAVVIFATCLMVNAGAVSAQDYPNKPIRIFTSQSGSPSDFMARLLAQGISGPLGQSVIVDNRVGIVATENVAKAPADGYTLLFYGPVVWLLPYLRDYVAWDPEKDFSAVTLATQAPNLLVIHPSLPVKSVRELIALAKARPGELNYGSGLTGSSNHMAAELFKSMAGVNIVRVPYSGPAAAFTAVIGGQLQLMFPDAGSASPHVKSGRIRALAISTAEPSALGPGLPTIAASGVPGYESGIISAMFAPAKTPAAIINRLNQEIVKVLNKPGVKERLFNSGVEVVGSSPEQLAAKMRSEMTRMGKVIKEAGIKAE